MSLAGCVSLGGKVPDTLLTLTPDAAVPAGWTAVCALAGVLVVVLGDDRAGALRAWRRDAAAHPSPNAGVVESSFAGALGLRLGGRTVYPHGVEERPALGDGHPPEVADLYSTTHLSRWVTA